MPPEALIKKKEEKDINNFVGNSSGIVGSAMLPIDKKFEITIGKRDEALSHIFKNSKLFKLGNDHSTFKNQNIQKLLDNNKFLARIQEKN